jgi:methyl-accepting chemotaxis protein
MHIHPVIAAGIPALAGILVAVAVATGGFAWSDPRILVAAGLGAVLAFGGAALTLSPFLRRLESWRTRLDGASHRLAELRAHPVPSPDEAVRTIAEFARLADEDSPDDPFDDALAGLEAALQDETRLRTRRESAQERVSALLRRGRELVGGDADAATELERLASRLAEIEQAVHAARDAGESTLASGIACDEVARLLEEHVKGGREAAQKAQGGATELERQIEIVSKLVRRLEARSREIGEVLLVLNDITEQTSLLALNAAIIAAQAGEQGKGFGVVADEMRNLSERAFSSTKETEMLAQTLRDDVGQAVRSMGEAAETLRTLRSALGAAGETSGVLVDVGGRTATTARATVQGAERQAGAVREIEGQLRTISEQRERLGRLEREVLTPARSALAEATELLEGEWHAGALRDSLRNRLDEAIRAIRDRRGRERRERERLEIQMGALRESGRRVAEAIEETRRRD